MGILFPVWEDGTFEQTLAGYRKTYYDATHHCSALIRFGKPNLEQGHDDGEPAGTAGLPILNAMRSAQLVNCGIIVIRYFGGTKLGKSGLIETYGETARACIEAAQPVPVLAATQISISARYDQIKTVELIFSRTEVQRLKTDYLDRVTITIQVRDEIVASIIEQLDLVTYTGISYEILGSGLVFENGSDS